MKTILNTAAAPKAIGPYSQAVGTEALLYTSGQLGIDPATGKLVDGVEAQAQQAMRNLGAILEARGLSYANIIKTTIFLASMADFSAVNAVYASYFSGDFPARSCVQVAALPLGGLVEIECIAAA
ncbi:MAG: RidA family protein [Candidatus Limiplasma sp.]|nr:RidA family protein [Candidatus Limiplasma sp.]